MYRFTRSANRTVRRRTRAGRLMCCLGAFGLVVAACGGDDDADQTTPEPTDLESTQDTSDVPSTDPPSTDGDAPGTDPEPVASDAVVRIVHGAVPNQFDPCGTLSGSEVSYMWAIYASLIRTDPRTGELSPGIATDWVWSDDFLELRLPIREGLTFQDGTPVDADSVARSIEQCLELGNQDVAGLETVVAEGDEVVFTLSTPTSGLPDLLGTRLGMIASPTARDELGNAFASQPVGAGPFTLESFTPGSSVVLERWDDYVDAGTPPAQASRIEVSIVSDPSAQVASLTSGSADYAFRIDPTAEIGLAEATGVTTNVSEGVAITTLNIDRTQPIMQDKLVRQAISHAIDRETVAEIATNGLTRSASVQPYPPGHPFHFDDLNDRYTYDPDRARELLAEAGYPDGFELRGVSLDGQRFVDNGLVISQQLAAVGIDVTFEARALPDATQAYYTEHQYDLFSTGMNSGPDWLTIYRRLLATNSAGNAGNVPLDGGDDALAAINAAYEDTEIEQALYDATIVFQEELPIIPLYFTPTITAWTDRLVGGEEAFALNGEADFTVLGIDG